MPFNQLVKKVRAQLGLSQEQLARELNISFSTVNRWENGRSSPSKMAQELFYNFCKKKNLDINVLQEGDGLHD